MKKTFGQVSDAKTARNAEKKLTRTDRLTDGRTDGPTDIAGH